MLRLIGDMGRNVTHLLTAVQLNLLTPTLIAFLSWFSFFSVHFHFSGKIRCALRFVILYRVYNTNIPMRSMKPVMCAYEISQVQKHSPTMYRASTTHILLYTYISICAQCGTNSRIRDNNPTETFHTSMDLIDRFFFILTFLLFCLTMSSSE